MNFMHANADDDDDDTQKYLKVIRNKKILHKFTLLKHFSFSQFPKNLRMFSLCTAHNKYTKKINFLHFNFFFHLFLCNRSPSHIFKSIVQQTVSRRHSTRSVVVSWKLVEYGRILIRRRKLISYWRKSWLRTLR